MNSENVSITSGLAYGIDTQAHKSALENNIRTYAVVGCGLDIIYPTQNKNLFNEIIEKGGAVISEFPLKTPPLAPNFPQRNRIVVGLSIATLVAEAQLKSGAMISANLALDYNRELMCIPGNVMNPNTTGIYHLIKNGAGIVCETKDILSYLNCEMKVTSKESMYDLTQDQEDVFEILSLEPKTFDEIALTAKMDVSKLMVVLTELELKGLIKQIDNKFFKCK